MSRSYDHLFKIIIIGDINVGKTCLLSRYADDEFTNNYLPTIGLDYKIKSVEKDGKKIRLSIVDCAGQERFRTLTKAYYRGADACIITYSVEDRQSFNSIESWMEELNLNATKSFKPIIVANKIDLNKNVQTHELKHLAESYGCKYFECSARLNVGVDQLFNELIGDMLNQFKNTISGPRGDEKKGKEDEIRDTGINIESRNEKDDKCCK